MAMTASVMSEDRQKIMAAGFRRVPEQTHQRDRLCRSRRAAPSRNPFYNGRIR